MSDGLGFARVVLTLIRRPVLLWEALRAGAAMRTRRGMLPSSTYVAWRVHTAYGYNNPETQREDLESYLLWRRRMRGLS